MSEFNAPRKLQKSAKNVFSQTNLLLKLIDEKRRVSTGFSLTDYIKSRENSQAVILDSNLIKKEYEINSLEAVLGVFDITNKDWGKAKDAMIRFDKCYNRKKIIEFLEAKSTVFEKEYLNPKRVDYAGSLVQKSLVIDGYSQTPKKREAAKRRYKNPKIVNTHFSDWVVSSLISEIFHGKTVILAHQSLFAEYINRREDFDDTDRIPAVTTIYDITRRVADKLKSFNAFMILLIGGLQCQELLVDDAFCRKAKKWLEIRQRTDSRAEKMRKNWDHYFFAIMTMDRYSKFIINLHIANYRDADAFFDALSKTRGSLRGARTKKIIGDLWKPMVHAARMIFPAHYITHDFKKCTIKEKKERNYIERRIRDVRVTIGKSRKHPTAKDRRRRNTHSNSPPFLDAISTIAWIGQNYIRPMEDALKGKSPAQEQGIPYPFDACKWNWRYFLQWVDWVTDNIEEILKAGS